MVDSHTHLSSCEQPDDELVAVALEAGVTRIVTIGTDVENSALALAAAERFPEVYAAVGLHPNEATGFDERDYSGLQHLAHHPRCVVIGETGLDYYREHAPHEDQARAFRAQIEVAREVGKPLSIHTRDADDDTLAILDEQAKRPEGDPSLLLDGRARRRVPRSSRLVLLVRRQRHLPQERGSARGDAARSRPGGCWSRPTRRTCRRSRCVASATCPRTSCMTAQAIALERRVSYHDFNLEVEAAAAAVFGW